MPARSGSSLSGTRIGSIRSVTPGRSSLKRDSSASTRLLRSGQCPLPRLAAGTLDDRGEKNPAHATWHRGNLALGNLTVITAGDMTVFDVDLTFDHVGERLERQFHIVLGAPIEVGRQVSGARQRDDDHSRTSQWKTRDKDSSKRRPSGKSKPIVAPLWMHCHRAKYTVPVSHANACGIIRTCAHRSGRILPARPSAPARRVPSANDRRANHIRA